MSPSARAEGTPEQLGGFVLRFKSGRVSGDWGSETHWTSSLLPPELRSSRGMVIQMPGNSICGRQGHSGVLLRNEVSAGKREGMVALNAPDE